MKSMQGATASRFRSKQRWNHKSPCRHTAGDGAVVKKKSKPSSKPTIYKVDGKPTTNPNHFDYTWAVLNIVLR